MVNRIFLVTLLSATLIVPVTGQSGQGTGSSRFKSGNITNQQWSTDRRQEGDTEVTTRTYQSLMAPGPRTLVIEEERRTQTGPDSWNVTRTTYNLDSHGRRKTIETIQEEQRISADGSEEINRTVSTPDSNGRFTAIRQEVEHSEKISGGMQSRKTIYEPDISGRFEAVRVTDTKQTTRPSGQIEIHQTTSSRTGQGKWVPLEQRHKVATLDAEGSPVSEWEQIFRRNARGRLALSEQTRSSYEREADGSERWQVDTETAPRGDAKLSLIRRVITSLKVLPAGGEEMIQEVNAVRLGLPSKKLELTERTITTSRPVGGDQTEISIEVQAHSANGGMRTVSRSSTTVANSGEEKEEKKPQVPGSF